MDNYKYFNRDISWLSFNHRVLEEARDKGLPLYERIKFLAIYSNNMEEFYRVRVSYYRSLLRDLPPGHPKIEEENPDGVLKKINKIVNKQQEEFSAIFQQEILPGLRQNNIVLVNEDDPLTENQVSFIKKIFIQDILPYLQPVLLFKKKVRPFLKTGHIYIILEMYSRQKKTKFDIKKRMPRYGLIKLPTDHDIPRFIELPVHKGMYYIIFLEDIVTRHLDKIFPGYVINSWYTIKVTRDGDLGYDDYDEEDLIEVIESISNRREVGKPNRFQYDKRMPAHLLKYLLSTFFISSSDLVKAGRYPNFRDFFDFPNPLSPKLESGPLLPLRVSKLEKENSIIKYLKKSDFILHYPYHSYNYFTKFLHEITRDKKVTEIKVTQYRLATNSTLVEALINAALTGKKVTVFVELKARFDEEMNLKYARAMKNAGINIIYSIPGLKVHAKVLLVLRKKDGEKQLPDFAYIGTGNFNEITAQQYSDHGYFTTNKGIVEDIANLFTYLECQPKMINFKHILVPGFNIIDRITELIDQEIKNAGNGKEAYICIKLNSLQDKNMINKLYEASSKGVKIDLIIRGICCLIPGEKYSQNIRVIRIIDRFLEHSRILWFFNNGENIIYMGSSDWMKRSFSRRIECVTPIYNEAIKKEIIDFLNIQLKDNVKARLVDHKLNNNKIEVEGGLVRCQAGIYDYLKNKIDSREV